MTQDTHQPPPPSDEPIELPPYNHYIIDWGPEIEDTKRRSHIWAHEVKPLDDAANVMAFYYYSELTPGVWKIKLARIIRDWFEIRTEEDSVSVN